MEQRKISGTIILEILGRPKETIEGALKAVVEKLSKEKGVSITNTSYHETVPVENAKDLFTTFVEVELTFDSIEIYYYILFAYMPSHVEIADPAKIELSLQHLNEFGNQLLQKLHAYDSIVKQSINEKNYLTKKLFEVAPHLFRKEEIPSKVEQKDKEEVKEPKKVKEKSKKSKKKK